jgi:hypothetical protein
MNMGGWHLRVVEDRVAALRHLRRYWPFLPSTFFRWLETAGPDQTYLLTACVNEPERWVMGNPPLMADTEALVSIPVRAMAPVLAAPTEEERQHDR